MLHWNVDFTCNKIQLINLKQYEVHVKESFELSEKVKSTENQKVELSFYPMFWLAPKS